MKTLPLLVALLLACSSMACAPLVPNVRYQAMGAADPARDRRINDVIEGDKPIPSESVTVLVDTIPEGIDVNTGVMRVAPGYQHKILGKVLVTQNVHVALIALLGFPDYATPWRKPYCYPQTVLNYATLTLWSLLVPLSYPCYGRPGVVEEDAITTLKRAGAAAGGDTVLASYLRLNDRILVVSGIVLKLDPRVKSKENADSPNVITGDAPGGSSPATSL